MICRSYFCLVTDTPIYSLRSMGLTAPCCYNAKKY